MIGLSIVKCPKCNDTWKASEYDGELCKCFKCGTLYTKATYTLKMWDFIFNLVKNCKPTL